MYIDKRVSTIWLYFKRILIRVQAEYCLQQFEILTITSIL